MISHHDALIYTMVLVSAADSNMTDAELHSIGEAVLHLPVFRDYDKSMISKTSGSCVEMLKGDDGLEKILKLIRAALPERLRETAYALACDVAAADGHPFQAELRFLMELRHEMNIERLHAAAIELGSRARHRRLPRPEL